MIELIETRGAVFFESGSATVRPIARQIVGRLAPILAKLGQAARRPGPHRRRAFAGPGGNMGLSSSRAISLMQVLRADGCPENQIKEVVGYGPRSSESPTSPLDFSNRRVTILIPREVQDGDAPRRRTERSRLREAGQPQAIDLAPKDLAHAGQWSQEVSG